MTLDDFHDFFPDIFRSLLGEIVSEKLGYKELCARWVPRMLTLEHSKNRVLAAREFLDRFELEGEEFLGSIMNWDETWICHCIPESTR